MLWYMVALILEDDSLSGYKIETYGMNNLDTKTFASVDELELYFESHEKAEDIRVYDFSGLDLSKSGFNYGIFVSILDDDTYRFDSEGLKSNTASFRNFRFVTRDGIRLDGDFNGYITITPKDNFNN